MRRNKFIALLMSQPNRLVRFPHMLIEATHRVHPSRHPQPNRASRSVVHARAKSTLVLMRWCNAPRWQWATNLVKARKQLNKIVIDRGPLGSHATSRACHRTAKPCGWYRSLNRPAGARNAATLRRVRQSSTSSSRAPTPCALLPTALATSSSICCCCC